MFPSRFSYQIWTWIALCWLFPLSLNAQNLPAVDGGDATSLSIRPTAAETQDASFPSGYSFIPDRRNNVYGDNSFGYFVLPLFIKAPGAKAAWAVTGIFQNLFSTPIDGYALYSLGEDIEAYGVALDSIPLFTKHLELGVASARANKVSATVALGRGFNADTKNKLEFTAKDIEAQGARLGLYFWERRIGFNQGYYTTKLRITSLKDRHGNELLKEDIKTEGRGQASQLELDFTDDPKDPLKGVNLALNYYHSGYHSESAPRFHAFDFNLRGYIPLLESSTLVLNSFVSFKDVYKKGELNYQKLKDSYMQDCGSANRSACEDAVDRFVIDQQMSNRFSEAAALGGASRLRSFPTFMFSAGKTHFLGAEFRWNFSHDRTPFDFLISKDIKTHYQLAFFLDVGSVGEQWVDLWKRHEASYGTGFRVVTASGMIYRFDLAFGTRNTFETIVMIGYPFGSERI